MFKIEEVSQNEIKLTGEFDASQAEIVTDFMQRYEVTLTLDLEELSYISSMGLGILVKNYHRLNGMGYKIILKNLNEHIKDVFKYTRLDQLFVVDE
tara:strand:+ start:673 stop:960 length:288 start_codon:yes stop_codon:yes gene_type:complete